MNTKPNENALAETGRGIERTNENLLREVATYRARLARLEDSVKGGFHAQTTGILEIDVLVAQREARVEALKMLTYAVGGEG